MNLADSLIITRKRLIKEINELRRERETIKKKMETDDSMKVDYRIINARLSEKWTAYNDVVRTSKLVEDTGK